MDAEEIIHASIEYAKVHRTRIARELTNRSTFTPDDAPVSAFMAGSPGAGKTEFSLRLLGMLESASGVHAIRIDADEIRAQFPLYTGNNSSLFQGPASLIIERVHDYTLNNRQSFIFDGTLSHLEKARKNINRSLDKKRPVFIFYVYQDPLLAWQITQAREKIEGRNIPKDAFIREFIDSRNVIEQLKRI